MLDRNLQLINILKSWAVKFESYQSHKEYKINQIQGD